MVTTNQIDNMIPSDLLQPAHDVRAVQPVGVTQCCSG